MKQQKKITKKHKTEKVGKNKSKATKAKIEKLNANLKEYESIRSLMDKPQERDKNKALDVKELQKDLNKQREKSNNDKQVENDIMKQLDMITGIDL